MKHITLFFVCVMTITGCQKNETAKPTTINGQVRTYGTTEKANHPPILLHLVHAQASGAIGGGRTLVVLDETWSDQDGYFSLNASLFPHEEYYIKADYNSVMRNKGYIVPATTPYERDRITRIGGTINQNYYLVGIGWVNFHFISENPQPGDLYTYSVGGGGYEEFYNSVDAYRLWDFSGNFEHDIVYTTVRNGNYLPTREYFFVPAFDTINYEIKFQ